VYGGLHLRTPIERQLPLLVALLAPPLVAHVFLTSLHWMAPWAFVAGLLIAPAMTAVATIVSMRAPAKHATEAFTWSSTAIVTGIGAGMAAGGWLIERFGPPAAFVMAAASAIIAGLLALRVSGQARRSGET
jgi:predicted MFS family arabinose efflux permease